MGDVRMAADTESPAVSVREGGPFTGRRTAAFLMVAALCACDHTPARVGADGGGGSPLTVETEPRVAVGVLDADPAHEFQKVTTPFLLPDGRLVVPVGGAGEIRIFDSGGHHLETLGGPGEGPGEFRSLGSVWARGDTIEAFDSELRRVTRFFPDGSAEAVALEATAPAQAAVRSALPDGWALASVAEVGVDGRGRTVPRGVA